MKSISVVLWLVLSSAIHAAIVAHYELETIAAVDTTGNTSSTVSGSPSVNAGGVIGNAFEFTGSNSQHVTFADPFFGDGSVTLSYWVKKDSAGRSDGPVGNWQGGRTILTRTTGTTLQVYTRSGGSQSSGTTGLSITDTNFHHLAVTFDGSTVRTYLDGVQGTSQTFNFATLGEAGSGTMAIGGRGSSERNMDGLVDDVALFDETLGLTQIRSIRNLALDSTLNYHASNAQALFDVFDGSQSSVVIGGLTWSVAADGTLTGSEGDVVDLGGGDFALILNSAGGGVTTVVSAIPEPSAAVLTMAGCLLFFRRRR